jgi:hypothetical protein
LCSNESYVQKDSVLLLLQKYWIPSTSWRWCQRLFYYQILNSFNKLKMMSEVVWLPNTEFLQQVEDDVRGCLTTKYWIPSTSWRWCQRLFYYQILTSFNKLKMMSEVFDYQILNSFNKLKMMSHKSLNNTQHLVKYGYYYNHKTIWLLFLHLNFIIYFS